MFKATGFYCRDCRGRMFTGQQYYAFQKNYIDLTCVKCASSVDIEVKKLNKILDRLGFNQIREHHDIQKTDSK